MTVSTSYAPASTAGNGVTTLFYFTWPALREADVFLVEYDVLTGAVVRTIQGTPSIVNLGTGAFDTTTAPANTNPVKIFRKTLATQGVDLTNTQPVNNDSVEGMSDKLTYLAQEAQYNDTQMIDLAQAIVDATAAAATAVAAKNAAVISAAAALVSENNAAGSESNAAGSASTATTQAGIATGAASAASGSASAASGSAAAALISENSAAISLASLEDLYIGPYASDAAANIAYPSRPVGALYLNTGANNLRAWSGAVWSVVAVVAGDFVLRDGTSTMAGDLDLGASSLINSGAAASINLTVLAKGPSGKVILKNGGSNGFVAAGVPSGANNLIAVAATTTNSPYLASEGADTNIDIALAPKGTGNVGINNSRLYDVADPIGVHDAVTKQYSDGADLAFQAYRSGSNQTIAATVLTKLAFTAEEYDTGGRFDSTVNYRYTPGVIGRFQMHASVVFTCPAAVGTYYISLYKNGAEFKRGLMGVHSASAAVIGSQVSVECNVIATDYFEVFFLDSATGSKSIEFGAYATYFWGCRS